MCCFFFMFSRTLSTFGWCKKLSVLVFNILKTLEPQNPQNFNIFDTSTSSTFSKPQHPQHSHKFNTSTFSTFSQHQHPQHPRNSQHLNILEILNTSTSSKSSSPQHPTFNNPQRYQESFFTHRLIFAD